MEAIVLRDVFISMGELEKYYEGTVPVNLWRGLNVKRSLSLFEFIEKPFKMSNGRVRKPDVTIENGIVKVKHWPRGIFTFNKPGVPSGKDWVHYLIPKGIELPDGLAIVEDSYNESFKATHYTIAPARDMSIIAFRILLAKFAFEVNKINGNARMVSK